MSEPRSTADRIVYGPRKLGLTQDYHHQLPGPGNHAGGLEQEASSCSLISHHKLSEVTAEMQLCRHQSAITGARGMVGNSASRILPVSRRTDEHSRTLPRELVLRVRIRLCGHAKPDQLRIRFAYQ